jgi:hypothetical protein
MSAPTISQQSTVVDLIAGVATGARDLTVAHLAQMKAEMASEMSRARFAALTLESAVGLCLIGIAFMLIALVYALIEQAQWPVWVAWIVVGGGTTVVGGTLVALGLSKLSALRPVPTRSLQSIRESLRWISNN